MTRIDTHTQSKGQVIATARINTRVLRVCGERPYRGCFVCVQLAAFIAHANRVSGNVDVDDELRARDAACDALDDASRHDDHDASLT